MRLAFALASVRQRWGVNFSLNPLAVAKEVFSAAFCVSSGPF